MLVINVPIGQLEKLLKTYTLGKVDVTTDMQQTLALLTASDDLARKILRASETGVLNVCSARIQDIIHVSNTNPNYAWHGDYKLTTECLVLAHPDNVGRIWVRPDKTATVNNSLPLGAGQGCVFPIDNLKNMYALIESANDVLIVLYTR